MNTANGVVNGFLLRRNLAELAKKILAHDLFDSKFRPYIYFFLEVELSQMRRLFKFL